MHSGMDCAWAHVVEHQNKCEKPKHKNWLSKTFLMILPWGLSTLLVLLFHKQKTTHQMSNTALQHWIQGSEKACLEKWIFKKDLILSRCWRAGSQLNSPFHNHFWSLSVNQMMSRKQSSSAPKPRFNNASELCAPDEVDQQHLEQETAVLIATAPNKSQLWAASMTFSEPVLWLCELSLLKRHHLQCCQCPKLQVTEHAHDHQILWSRVIQEAIACLWHMSAAVTWRVPHLPRGQALSEFWNSRSIKQDAAWESSGNSPLNQRGV